MALIVVEREAFEVLEQLKHHLPRFVRVGYGGLLAISLWGR